MIRPYWFDDARLSEGIYIGITKGEWPIRAFSADNTQHLDWAAGDPEKRILIGPIPVPDDAPFSRGRTVPASHVLDRLDES